MPAIGDASELKRRANDLTPPPKFTSSKSHPKDEPSSVVPLASTAVSSIGPSTVDDSLIAEVSKPSNLNDSTEDVSDDVKI